jgi:hypothetical protein
MENPKDPFQTDKIGFAAYLIVNSIRLLEVRTKSRNRASFVFDLPAERAADFELEYTRSDHSKFFEAFKYLRDRTIRGSK